MTLTPAAESLTTRATRAAQWRLASAFISALSQLVVGALLARLLTPADFGITALAYVVLGLAQPLGDLGLGSAVVQRTGLTDRHLRTAFTCAVLVGVAVAAVIAVAAPLGAALMRDARVESVLRVLSVGIAFRGASVVAEALLRRNLDFRRQFVIETASYLVGYGAVAIGLALLGHGVWSLVWGGLVQTLIASIAQLAVVRHPIRPLLARHELDELLGFGLGAAASACVNYAALNGDYFVIGRLMGAFNLGLYNRAYGLMNLPHNYAGGVMSAVMFPMFAQVQGEPARVRTGYLAVTRLTAMIAAPAMTTMAIVAPHLLPALYGPQWTGAVVPLQILSIAGYFRALYHLGGIVAQSLGRVYAELWRQVIYAAAVIGGTLLGSRYGLPGVAVGVSLAILYMFVATGHLALSATGTSLGAYLRAQRGAVVTAAFTGAVALFVRLLLEAAHMSAAAIALAVLGAAAVPWSLGMLSTLDEPEFGPLWASPRSAANRFIEAVRALGGTRQSTSVGTAASTSCHVLIEQATAAPRTAKPGRIRAFAKCRNERLRLPAFLDHYRHLGVDAFFIIDNDSSDGTTEFLADQSDVRLFRTAGRFSESRGGTDWLNGLLGEFGVGSWCVTVDIDELLVYPDSEHTTLRTLTEYLDRSGYEALSCLLLDLYPGGPLHESSYLQGGNLLTAAPYFDVGPYQRSPVDSCPGVLIRGGMRERIFYPAFRKRRLIAKIYSGMCYQAALRMPFLREMPWIVRARRHGYSPCLTKVPLVRWDERSAYVYSNHFVSPKVVAPDTGVLLHFKFLQDFHARAIQEAQRAERYDGAFGYRLFAEKLDQNPAMTFMDDASARFEGTSQLVRLGLMHETESWVDARERKA
jgi:O-antigen/teichoic acid export membrane protein